MAQGSIRHSTHGAADAHACGPDHAGARLKASQPGMGHHQHAPSTPHPAQAVPWSLLRVGLAARLGGSLLIVVALWIVVLATLRPL